MAKKKSSVIRPEMIKAGYIPDSNYDRYSDMRNEDTGNLIMPNVGKKFSKIKEAVVDKKVEDLKKQITLLGGEVYNDEKVKKSKKKKKDKKKDEDDDSLSNILKANPKLNKKKKKKKDSDKKGKKKNKKGKKKPKHIDDDYNDNVDFFGRPLSGKKKKKKKNKSKNKIKLDGLVVKNVKKFNKSTGQKKEVDPVAEIAKRFADVEKLTKDNMVLIDNTLVDVNKRVADLMKDDATRVRGRDTAISNYIGAKCNLISSRQKAVNDILNLRSKVVDFENKEKAIRDKAVTGNGDAASQLARLIPSLAKNPKLMNQLGVGGDHVKKGKNKKKKDDDDDRLAKRIRALEKSGDVEFTSYEKNIDWEGKFRTIIIKSFKTQEWKFAALDNSGKVISDIPKSVFPPKKSVSMQFDDENDKAIDTLSGTPYEVISKPAI